MAVVCALGSALMYALASVAQQRAAAAAPAHESLRLSLIVRLARRPLWLLGIAFDLAGFVLQFLALQHGSLVLVQPLLVCGLLFALPLGAAIAGGRLTSLDWAAAAAVCGGLTLFLVVAGAARGHGHPTDAGWVVMVAGAGVVAAALVAAGERRPPNQRAALLSAAAGVIYGLSAGFTKATGHILHHHGLIALLSSWQAAGLVITGVLGMVVSQSAFQAGALEASLPPMTVIDPVVSVLIGAAAFGEALPLGAGSVFAEVVGLVLTAAGVVALARSKAVYAIHGSGLH